MDIFVFTFFVNLFLEMSVPQHHELGLVVISLNCLPMYNLIEARRFHRYTYKLCVYLYIVGNPDYKI